MASKGRNTRRAANSTPSVEEPDLDVLSNLERLLVSQAVYEFGSNAWSKVSELLSRHPMLSRPKGFFTPQSCNAIYVLLMNDAELELTEANVVPKAPTHHRLAKKHWDARMQELRTLIGAEEATFQTLVKEIDEIRAGEWDDKIREKYGLPPRTPEPVLVPEEAQAPLEPVVSEPMDPVPPAEEDIEPEAVPQESAEITPEVIEVTEEHPPATLAVAEEIAEVIDVDTISDADAPAPEAIEVDAASPIVVEDESEPTLEETPSPKTEDAPPPHSPSPSAVEVEEVQPEEPAAEDSDTEIPDVEDDKATTTASGDEESRPEIEASEAEDSPEPKAAEDASTPSAEAAAPRNGKRKAADTGTPSPGPSRDKKRAREDSEQVEDDEVGGAGAGGGRPRQKSRPATAESHAASKRFQTVISMLHSQISQHRSGNIFHNPIKTSEAPDYHDIVKRPIDLKTIKAKVREGGISNSLEFQRDICLMFANALMYNRPNSDIYKMAEEMMFESEELINTFRQTEGMVKGRML